MKIQEKIDFERIASAIDYLLHNFKNQPNLDEIAQHVNMSTSHFQRTFTNWAGTSPKKFVQYLSVDFAKEILRNSQTTVLDATLETGLSSTSRLHDLFVNIEGMTPSEYKNGGQNLIIHYCFEDTKFGPIIIASTSKGICFISFYENEDQGFQELINQFPNAQFECKKEQIHQNALKVFQDDYQDIKELKLHLKGSDFQLKVWEALLKIPMGNLTTYGEISSRIQNPKASRAVGSAIGKNPIAYLIPCHRVIQNSGIIGEYRWNSARKKAIVGWEIHNHNL